MNLELWRPDLEKLDLGDIYLFQEVGSTNLEAERLIEKGAAPFSVVLADSQTAGKGRQGRSWVTEPGQTLAVSLILYPEPGRIQAETLGRISGLGALAICETLREEYGLKAEIKWPNDVLVDDKKIAGILVEVHWDGCRLQDVILGMGVNVYRQAIAGYENFTFPATTLEESFPADISRLELLTRILTSLKKWYIRLAEPSLIKAWNDLLAYKGQQVTLSTPQRTLATGQVLGVDEEGTLLLELPGGEIRHFHSGEISLRLVDRS
jgi:BirA family biotin operon repressor/biotin-[acetyl-CoA-carboxylase] ligase